MAQGQNAQKNGHIDREYNSRRYGRCPSLCHGKIGRWITRRHERAIRRRIEHQIMRDVYE